MGRAPKVSLVIEFIGVQFSVFWTLLIPLFFPLAILRLFSRLIPNLALDFYFSFSGGQGLKYLG